MVLKGQSLIDLVSKFKTYLKMTKNNGSKFGMYEVKF